MQAAKASSSGKVIAPVGQMRAQVRHSTTQYLTQDEGEIVEVDYAGEFSAAASQGAQVFVQETLGASLFVFQIEALAQQPVDPGMLLDARVAGRTLSPS